MTKQVLLINLDNNLQFPFIGTLKDNGNILTESDSTIECFHLLRRHQYDFVILNITTPKFSDFSVLINLRNACNIPVLLFSKQVEQFDLIHALELGASDYFSHDIHPRELLARITAHTRLMVKQNTSKSASQIVLHDVTLCAIKRTVVCNGEMVNLTGIEFELLYFLMVNAGQILSREILGKVLFNKNISSADRSLDVHVSNIRKKLNISVQRQRIQTIRGNGYLYLDEQIQADALATPA